MNPGVTLQSLVDSLPAWGSRPAVGLRGECGSYWFSYIDLYRMAHTVARNLAPLQLQPGARVVIWSSNSPEWVGCLLGATMLGLVAVPADAASDAATIAEIIRQTGAVLLIFGSEKGTAGFSTPARSILEVTRPDPAGSADVVTPAVTPDQEAVILFTSGSSGNARGVVLSHGNLMSQLARFRYWRGLVRIFPVRMLALSPLSHVQGLILGALLPLSLGLSTLYTQSIEPSQIVTSIRLGRIGILLAVPGVLELIERKLVREISARFGWEVQSAWRLPLMRAFRLILGPRFRMAITGGATLMLDRERFWRRAGTLLVQGYGATETSAIATVNWPLIGRTGSVGVATRSGALRLAEDGEIEIRGPHVSPGVEVTEDGYYRTGDLGWLDRNRRLFLTGRKHDLIVTAEGNNVNPAGIESALLECQGIRASMVAGIARERGEEIHAVLILQENLVQENDDARAIIRDANSRLPNGQRIQSWSIWPDPDFPRGALGKVRRGEVMRRIQNGHAPLTGEAQAAASIEECLVEPDWRRRLDRLSRYFVDTKDPRGPRDLADYLKDLGLDSIHIIQVAARIDELRGVSIDTAVEQVAGAQALPAAACVHLRPQKEAPPKWQFWHGLTALRAVVRALTLDPVLRLRLRTASDGAPNLAKVRAPCILALPAEDRQHPGDYLAVYRALPGRLGRRMLPVMRSNPPDGFAPYLHPDGHGGTLHRWVLAALFHVGLPLNFPFALFPASTTRSTMLGLAHAAAGIERGYCPVVVWGTGSALLAAETRCTVLPIRLSGNQQLKENGLRLRVNVRFGRPFEIPPGMAHHTVAAEVEKLFAVMKP